MDHTDDEFTAFARAEQPRLLHAALLLTGDHGLAEDLVQETLIKTYLAWRRVRDGEAHAYARRVLVNDNIDRWRRTRRQDRPTTTGALPDRGRPDRHLVEERDDLVRLLAPLTRRERTVVVLRYFFDLTEQATADELGISVGTVKSTCSRALARIQPTPATEGSQR